MTTTGYPEDEIKTKPDAAPTDPTALVLVRIHGELCDLDRKRLARLVENWYSVCLNQRVVIESVASEFARPSRD